MLANLVSDEAILGAIHSNELDTNTAYSRMCEREDVWESAREVLKRGLEDEKRHKAWIEKTLEISKSNLVSSN